MATRSTSGSATVGGWNRAVAHDCRLAAGAARATAARPRGLCAALDGVPGDVPGRCRALARSSGRQGRAGCRAGAAAAPDDDHEVALRLAPVRLGPGPAAGGNRPRSPASPTLSRPRLRQRSWASSSSAPATSPVRRPRASPPGSRRSPSIMSGRARRSWPSCSAWRSG